MSQAASVVCARRERPSASSARSSPTVPQRSATTSWSWIVSRFTLAREDEVLVGRATDRVEELPERDAHRVLHEARPQMGVLDDEQLVRALQELVDRRAHRALDDPYEVLGVELARRADEQCPATALVVRRDRDELEDPLDLVAGSPPRASRSAARPRTRPCAHGQALIPVASTPTTRREPAPFAAAIPIRETISWVVQAGDRRPPPERPAGDDPHLGAERALALDDLRRDPVGEDLHEQPFAEDRLVDRLVEELREARHVDALLIAGEIDGAVDAPPP